MQPNIPYKFFFTKFFSANDSRATITERINQQIRHVFNLACREEYDALLVAGLGFASPVLADDGHPKGEAQNDRGLRLLSLTPVPVAKANTTPGMYVFDISFVDQATQTYYLADRSNAAVDVVDAASGKFIEQIQASPAFAGFVSIGGVAHNELSGPDGVVSAFPWLFVTDAGSRVVSFDLRTTPPTQVSDVTTKAGDPLRADELAYDPEDGLILAINNADTPAPFGTLISVDKNTGKLTVGKRITFDAAHGVDATNGAEQPIWDPSTHRFYLSIPQIGATVSNGGVVRINPATATVEATYPVSSCGPAGLSRGPGEDGRHDALIGCNLVFDTTGTTVWSATDPNPADPRDVIIDLASGSIDREIFGAGAGDEVWYNPGDNNFYAPSGFGANPTVTVIDGDSGEVTGTLPAGPGSHSVAAYRGNNHIFVPIAIPTAAAPSDACNVMFGMPEKHGCIAVYAHEK